MSNLLQSVVTKPVVFAVICVGLFLIPESLVSKALALTANDFNMENQRTHKRNNYKLQRAIDKENLGSFDKVGVNYEMEPLDFGRNQEELSAFIDYANMIDDVTLLDKSVEMRTRKRGNIKLEKYNNQAIPDPPCSCKSISDTLPLGLDTFPKTVEIRICDKGQQQGCAPPYVCQEIYYNIIVLKRRTLINSLSSRNELIPGNLNVSWAAEHLPVSVGCECKRDYTYDRN